MALISGTKLGPYEILAPLGAGGMGEVYRARDTRLEREVAVKVLPESFARDPERMRRFEQEARAIAALSHPNVLAIFETDTHEGVPYLVSELLEGESLRQRLREGPVPARKAVEYAQQVADGLAAAHEKGIVHRDLKPENLFLTAGGRAKILDFGLAKLERSLGTAMAADGAADTLGSPTAPGVVMGTTGYMAPEQVRGDAVDHRADIFSFGATLYEMLSGQRAFKGETSVETMNAILKEEPPELEAEKLHVTPGLERIVRHCLEKKPADRFQSARDLTFALGALSGSATSSALRVPAPRRPWMVWAAGAMGVVILVLALMYAWMQHAEAPERAEFAVPVPGEVSHLAISHDGRWLALVSAGESGSEPMVYVQRLGSPGARAIPGTEGASYPFWSPDDSYLAFFAKGKLKKVAVAGGEPENLANMSTARGGSWGSKGVIIYTPASAEVLWRVNADGSGAAPLTEKLLSPTEASHRWPFFLPDGDHFLMFAGNFGVANEERSNGIYLSSLSKLEKVELVPTHSSAAYADGRIYYVDGNGALVSVTVGVGAAKVTGEPQVVASKVALSPSTYYGTFAVSENSTVVYSSTSSANYSQLTWFDAAGKELGRVGAVGVLANPSLSPDGKRVAFDSNDFKAKNVDVWILDLEQGSSSRFTFDPEEETTPAWSRDGSTIAYFSNQQPIGVHLKKANGLEPDKRLAAMGGPGNPIVPNSWSLDNKEILCTYVGAKGSSDLVLAPTDGSAIRPFHKGAASETNGEISPDGKWLAYASNETGDWEIYVTTFPGAAGKWQVSRGGGTEPRWRGDGKEIFYIGPKQVLTAVPVSTGGTFSTGTPRPLFAVHARAPISSTDLFTYDVTRDGKRFLVNQYVKPEQVLPLTVVLHASAVAVK